MESIINIKYLEQIFNLKKKNILEEIVIFVKIQGPVWTVDKSKIKKKREKYWRKKQNQGDSSLVIVNYRKQENPPVTRTVCLSLAIEESRIALLILISTI